MSGFVNQLCYGDNLEVLRKMPDEIADLVYLDPPFNSARNYNLLFKQHKGQDSPAQIMAFEDTWQWSTRAYRPYSIPIGPWRHFGQIGAEISPFRFKSPSIPASRAGYPLF